MNDFIHDMRHTLVPTRGGPEGPLPLLLVGMTMVTGLVDAFSYLTLGHVFVANMTGNVVFLGFALAGASGFSITASLLAIAAFWAGAFVGGHTASRLARHRARFLASTTTVQSVLVAAAVVVAALSGSPVTAVSRYVLIAALGMAMGVQNAAARRLAVRDLTTTVLTLTITGMAADSSAAGGSGSQAGRRIIAVTAMLLGALVGAALVLHVHIVIALVVALAVLVGVATTAGAFGASDSRWALTD